MTQPHISIIGAGLSGLVLARCLLQRGIASTIFERDSAQAASKRYNYGIALHRWAYAPLLKCLGLDEPTFRGELAVDAAVGGTGRLGNGLHGLSFRANRQRLEQMLREGLDIRCEHQLTEIGTEGWGNVLKFGNGEQRQSEVVVGADGPHSQVRKHLSPTTRFSILPFAVYNGKRRLSREQFDTEYASYMEDTNVIERRDGPILMQITISDRTEDVVSISYTYSRPARPGDPIFDPDRPNSGAKDISEALFAEVAGLQGLEGPFMDVFDARRMREDRLLNWLMRTVSVEEEDLARAAGRGIVLMGDAVHATPILGGQGALAAIEDGVKLAEFIAEHGSRDLADFCTQRQRAWKEYVDVGERMLESMHGGKANL